MNGKVMILVPGKNARGGITNYYRSIKKHFGEDVLYCERGSRNWPRKTNILSSLVRMLADYLIFIKHLLTDNISLVQTTTAFYKDALIRDAFYIVLAKVFKKKVIIFFRGWDNDFAHGLSGIYRALFIKIYLGADAFIDLSEANCQYLREMGFTKKIYQETTLVDRELVEGFQPEPGIHQRFRTVPRTILFLSRLEKAKGIFRILDIYQTLKKKDARYRLVFAGDGTETANLIREVKSRQIEDVQFTGYVQGNQKKELYEKAALFMFMSEFEGMPNAVLEAMAFALPVVTTDVGGIASVFNDGENGLLVGKDETIASIIRFIEELFSSNQRYAAISRKNYHQAREKFWSDRVAGRMKKIFETTVAE